MPEYSSDKKLSFEEEVEHNISDWEQDEEKFTEFAKEDEPDKVDKEDLASIQLYMKDIGDIPFLSREEEKALGKRIKEHDSEAVNILVQANLKLVVAIAKSYTGRGLDIMDLIGEGNIGLIKAAEKFDNGKNCRFDTYATYWIRAYIGKALNEQVGLIRLPMHARLMYNKIRKFQQKFIQANGKEPSLQEISDYMNVSTEKITRVLNASKDVLAIDKPINSEENKGTTFAGNIADAKGQASDPDEIIMAKQRYSDLMEILDKSCADDKERRIMLLRYGFADGRARSLTELSREFRMTREGVRQIEVKMKDKFRRRMPQPPEN